MHQLGSGILILPIPGRTNDVLLEEILDVLVGATISYERPLSLIHDFLYDMREILSHFRLALPFDLSCFSCIEKVHFSYKSPIDSCVHRIILCSFVLSALMDIEGAHGLGSLHSADIARWDQLPILVLQW